MGGAREIQKRLTNTLGWSATSGQVDNWVYEDTNATFMEDEEMRNRLMETNHPRLGRWSQPCWRPTAGATGTPPRRTLTGSDSCTRRSRTRSRAWSRPDLGHFFVVGVI